jgi:colanic acid biosynthesis glycosyl transferase WcaI
LYPDVAVEAGKLRNPALVGAARVAEKLVYRLSDRIIVLSDGFRRTLEARGVPTDKIDVVPVWLDPDEIRPSSRDNDWRREHGIALEKTVVLYAGTIGLVSGAEVVVDAAARLGDRDDILFLFVGEGRVKDELESEVSRRRLANVRFLPFQPRERLQEVQATADIALVTLLPGRGRTSVPSKVVGYMAAGRPIVASVDADSDTASAVLVGGSGVVVPPGRGDLLAEAVRRLADSTTRPKMGEAARRSFEAVYAKPSAFAKLRSILERLAGDARS